MALSEVVKSYGNTSVLTGIDLEIARGELIVLLGPSGSGKTTLLNLIALDFLTRRKASAEAPSRGELWIYNS